MKTALLVIDAQKIYTDPKSEMFCKDAKATVKRINKLIEKFQKNNLPIIFVRHIHKADGTDIGRMFDYLGEAEEEFNFKDGTEEIKFDENLKRPSDAIEIVKNRYSAFVGTDLEKKLKKLGVESLAICGFMTNLCCESTARDAHDRDYFVDFVLDATGTPGTENIDEKKIRSIVGELLVQGFARVMSTEEYIKTK